MIHPTAILEGEILLPDESEIEIGPYAVLRGRVRLGCGCRIGPHALVEGDVEMGESNTVGHGACIGGDPQDLGFDRSTASGVRIGSGNTFRENVTIHRATRPDAHTMVGDGNFLMAGAHLAHDVTVGDRNVFANNVLVAGHVSFGSGCFVGGAAVFHQFIRIGDGVMVQGMAGFSLDLPPHVLGHRINEVAGLNVVGLRRAGVPAERRAALKRAYDLVYVERLPLERIQAEASSPSWQDEAAAFLRFFLTPSRKGVLR